MQSIDNGVYKRSLDSLKEYPSLLISFSLYKGLTTLFFFLTPMFPTALPAPLGGATSITFFCVVIAGCCVFFASAGRKLKIFDNPRYLTSMSAVLILGILSLCYFTPHITSPVNQAICYCLGVLMTCLGACAIHIEFGRLMGYLGSTYTLIYNVGCSVLGLPITAILLNLPLLARTVCSLALIVIMVHTFFLALNKIGKAKVYGPSNAHLTIPWRFLGTSFAQGVSVGLAVTVFSHGASMGIWFTALSIFIASAVAVLLGLVMRVDYDRLIYHVGFSVIGLACALTTIVTHDGVLHSMPHLLLFTAYVYLDIILWSLGSHLIKNCDQPAIWVAACPSASLMAGRVIGSAIGIMPYTQTSTAESTDLNAALAALATFAFMAVAVFMSSSNNLKNGWGFIKPTDEDVRSDREWACSLIAEDFHLTQRERDVLFLLAQGVSRADIAAELVVTPNTVKTHVRNLYSKLNVHSSDELLKLIAHQQQTFETH